MIALESGFLRGSYAPVITPFLESGAVDYCSYERLVDFQIRKGSHGIVVNGTTAEPSVLSLEERKALLDLAIRTAAHRVPVVAATGSQSHAETASLTEHASKAGADALLIVTPYYIRPPQRGLVSYYKDLAGRTDLPILMYHIPGRTGVSVTLQSLEAIAATVPHFVGLKHAASDLALVSEALMRFGPEFRVFVGLEDLSLPMLALGACGMVNAVSNIAPGAVGRLYEAVASGNLKDARQMHYQLFELNGAVFFDTNPIPIKYMARRIGLIPANHHRLPLLPASPEVEERLDAVLASSNLISSVARA